MPKLTHENDGLIYNPTNEVNLMLLSYNLLGKSEIWEFLTYKSLFQLLSYCVLI